MRTFLAKLLVAVLAMWGTCAVYGNVSYELGCVTAYQKKSSKIEVPVFSADINSEAGTNISIPGHLYVAGKRDCMMDLSFPTLEKMVEYAQETYCIASKRPVGEVFFTPAQPNFQHKFSLGHSSIATMQNFSLLVNYGKCYDGVCPLVSISRHITCEM